MYLSTPHFFRHHKQWKIAANLHFFIIVLRCVKGLKIIIIAWTTVI